MKTDFGPLFPGGQLGHAAEVRIHCPGTRVPAAAIGTRARAVGRQAFRQAHSPSKAASPLNSASRKRSKPQKLQQRPRTLVTHLLQPRVPYQHTSPARRPITLPEKGAPRLHRHQRKALELLHPPSLNPPRRRRGPLTFRQAGTGMEKAKMTLYPGIKRKCPCQGRAKIGTDTLALRTLRYHHCHCPK